MDSEFLLDPLLVRRRFQRAASAGEAADPLSREVAQRMAERLDYIRISPRRILDLGSGRGLDQPALAQRFPAAERIAADFAWPALRHAQAPQTLLRKWLSRTAQLRAVCADARQLPLAGGSVSLVWSNLMLQWLTDPLPVFAEAHRVLESDGLFMFSTLGPDTLRELREALDDSEGRHVHRFIDMHDLGDALVRAGFANPVMDMDMLTVRYPDTDTLLRDLRRTGSSNAAQHRMPGLGRRSTRARLHAGIARLAQPGGFTVSFEIVQGHAWKAPARKTADGRDIIRFRQREPAP